MKIIFSPAKTMQEQAVDYKLSTPLFLKNAEELLNDLRSLSPLELKKLYRCSDELAELNYQRFKEMDLLGAKTPAILAYRGLSYQHLQANSFDMDTLDYLNEHLLILSAFYGLLRPLDKIVPYRLEMKGMAHYWSDKLHAVIGKDVVLNLASEEYAGCLRPYLKDGDQLIDCRFMSYRGTKLVQGSSYAKMARGALLRKIALERLDDLKSLKAFNEFGFVYNQDLSTSKQMVWIR